MAGSGDETPIWGESRKQRRRHRTGAVLSSGSVAAGAELRSPPLQSSSPRHGTLDGLRSQNTSRTEGACPSKTSLWMHQGLPVFRDGWQPMKDAWVSSRHGWIPAVGTRSIHMSMCCS